MSEKEQPEPEITCIADAIVAVMRDSGAQLGYDERNEEEGYPYVSINKMMVHFQPLFTKHGLVLCMNEKSFKEPEPGSTNNLCWGTYEFWFMWKNEQTPREAVTQAVIFKREQSIGKLPTYCMKQWLRKKFLIATGEDDIDANSNKIGPGQAAQAKQQNDLKVAQDWIRKSFQTLGLETDAALNWILDTNNKSFNPTQPGQQPISQDDLPLLNRFVRLCANYNGTDLVEQINSALLKKATPKDTLTELGLR